MKKKRMLATRMGMVVKMSLKMVEKQLRQEKKRMQKILWHFLLGPVQIVTLVMLKTSFPHISASVEDMKSHQLTICSFLILVVNIAKRKSMKHALIIAVMCFAIQVVAHHVQLMFQLRVTVVKKSKEFHVKLLQDQSLRAKTFVESF